MDELPAAGNAEIETNSNPSITRIERGHDYILTRLQIRARLHRHHIIRDRLELHLAQILCPEARCVGESARHRHTELAILFPFGAVYQIQAPAPPPGPPTH